MSTKKATSSQGQANSSNTVTHESTAHKDAKNTYQKCESSSKNSKPNCGCGCAAWEDTAIDEDGRC
jgi:hypothetical protein